MTGLSAQVIRKWEDRYSLIRPARLENGYRVYTEADVARLLKVKSLLQKGMTARKAAALAKQEHERNEAPAVSQEESFMNHYVIRLLEKGAKCDENEINLILKQAYHFYGLSVFLTSVAIPFLREVGNRWETGEWDEFQESVSSLVVRDYLVQIRRNFQYEEGAGLIVGACLPHEQHEVPVHIILLQCMMRGWKTSLIGASPAPGSIEALVERLQPVKVLLSASTTIPFDRDPELLRKLDRFAAEHKETAFYLGGEGSMKYMEDRQTSFIHVTNSIDDILRD